MAKYGEFPMIDMEDLNDLELLKTHRCYFDEFQELPKDRQAEIYRYCKFHATFPACRANLEQICYAVSKIYFGY